MTCESCDQDTDTSPVNSDGPPPYVLCGACALRLQTFTRAKRVGFTGVSKHIRASKAFTAETWRDDFNVHRGAVFNLSHRWLQLGPLRPKVKSPDVDGLYWVGGGTHPGSGLLTIIESANIAADHLCGGLGGWPYTPPLADEPNALLTAGSSMATTWKKLPGKRVTS